MINFNYKNNLSEEENNRVIDFLKEYNYLLKKNNLVELYDNTKGTGNLPALITQFLSENDIDIFKYLDYIPSFCFLESSIENIHIQPNIEYIGLSAFSRVPYLKEILIPGTIKEIKDFAFCECKKLSDVVLEEGVTSIGEGIFKNCNHLSRLWLPKSLTTIAKRAFFGAPGESLLCYCPRGSYAEVFCEQFTHFKVINI